MRSSPDENPRLVRYQDNRPGLNSLGIVETIQRGDAVVGQVEPGGQGEQIHPLCRLVAEKPQGRKRCGIFSGKAAFRLKVGLQITLQLLEQHVPGVEFPDTRIIAERRGADQQQQEHRAPGV